MLHAQGGRQRVDIRKSGVEARGDSDRWTLGDAFVPDSVDPMFLDPGRPASDSFRQIYFCHSTSYIVF